MAHSLIQTPRISWVDYAKGICILLVVMLHVVGMVEETQGTIGWMQPVVDFSMPFRMPDFFLISGLFLARSLHGPLGEYLDRKVVHFAYFYILWLVLLTILFETQVLLSSPLDYFGLLAASLVNPYGPVWFVHMLAIFYIVTRLLTDIPVVFVLVAAGFLQTTHTLGWVETPLWAVNRFAAYYVFFFAGYALAAHWFAVAEWAQNHLRVAALALMGWACGNGALVAAGLHTLPGVSLILGFAGAMAITVMAAFCARLQVAKALRYIGQHSIVVYLTHAIPVAVIGKLLERVASPLDAGSTAFLALALTVLGCLGVFWVVRGTPLRILYERPAWARLSNTQPKAATSATAS